MTAQFEYYNNEGNNASSAVVTKEAETRILNFDPERKLRELNKNRGKISLLASELATA